LAAAVIVSTRADESFSAASNEATAQALPPSRV
jgi:hypothetical protein